ncbi:MAG: hypothetical protein ACKV2V_21465, partial [Blastocatellia bacterium]
FLGGATPVRDTDAPAIEGELVGTDCCTPAGGGKGVQLSFDVTVDDKKGVTPGSSSGVEKVKIEVPMPDATGKRTLSAIPGCTYTLEKAEKEKSKSDPVKLRLSGCLPCTALARDGNGAYVQVVFYAEDDAGNKRSRASVFRIDRTDCCPLPRTQRNG